MIERKKAEALAYINHYRLLQQVRELERPSLDLIIDEALGMDDQIGHWHAYERLKKQAKHIVGWHARSEELNSSAHYQVMVTFLDWLLTEKRRSLETQEDIEMIECGDFDEWE